MATFEAPESCEEDLVARLWAAGSAGSWSPTKHEGRARIEAFFGTPAPSVAQLSAIAAAADASFLGIAAAPEHDWLADWRAATGAIAVGRRFLVDPREPGEATEPVEVGDRLLLRLPARTAFGVGSHESTRLAVELLEAARLAGLHVIDVGTGTGVLALAALTLGARAVVAFDLDPAAALLLPQMMALNERRFLGFAGPMRALSPAARFDLALVNVVPSEIADDLGRLAAAVVPGGGAIFSGILVEQAGSALERLAAAGFVERARRTAGEWIAFATERLERAS